MFKVGRRKFCRVADFYEWLDKIATGKIDATLVARQAPAPQRRRSPPAPASASACLAERRPKRGEERPGHLIS